VRVTATYKKNKTKQQALSPFLLDFFRSTSHRSVLFVSPCSLFQAAGRVTIGLLAFGFPSGLQAVLQCICCSRRLAGESWVCCWLVGDLWDGRGGRPMKGNSWDGEWGVLGFAGKMAMKGAAGSVFAERESNG
jgi:hypothetical protein